MRLKLLAVILITCCFYTKTRAQDPIFTQYFLVPETLNAGFTGFMETTYAGIIHREQWPELDLSVDTDYAFVNTWSDKLNSGIGLNILKMERHQN